MDSIFNMTAFERNSYPNQIIQISNPSKIVSNKNLCFLRAWEWISASLIKKICFCEKLPIKNWDQIKSEKSRSDLNNSLLPFVKVMTCIWERSKRLVTFPFLKNLFCLDDKFVTRFLSPDTEEPVPVGWLVTCLPTPYLDTSWGGMNVLLQFQARKCFKL